MLQSRLGRNAMRISLVMAILVVQVSVGMSPARAATLTVTSTGDASDDNPGDGVCDDGSGACTLRAAIQEANALAGSDTITFDVSSPYTISPGSALPDVTGATHIDATTQPGYVGSPVVVLDGTSAGSADGLTFTASGSSVSGLRITNFSGDGVSVTGAGEAWIRMNSIHGNGGLAINLVGGSENAFGVTENDAGDPDSGPNHLLNYPVITSAIETSGTVDITYGLDVPVFESHRVDFYRVDSADPSGHGEAQTYLGSDIVWLFQVGPHSTSLSGSAGDRITAVATRCIILLDWCARTSEMSPVFQVVPSNYPPNLDPIGSQSGDELTSIGFAATATDPEDDSLTFSLSGQPTGATIHPTSGVFQWTPGEDQGPGTYNFDVVVTDDGIPNESDSETITITVGEVNVGPSLDPIGNQIIPEMAAFAYPTSVTDPDLPANTLNYSLDGEPAGATIDASGVFRWTPDEVQGPGPYTFEVVVDDGVLEDRASMTVTVQEVNVAPSLDPIGDRTVDEGSELQFTATADDDDVPVNGLTFSLSGAPAGATIHPDTGLFTWTPTEAQGPGTYDFDVVVTDDGDGALSDSEGIRVTVSEDNTAPTLHAIGDHAGQEGTEISITVTGDDAADIPANSLTFSLSGAPTGAAIDPDSGLFTWTPTEAQAPGQFNFTFVVTDDGSPNLSDTEAITIDLSEVNSPPRLDPISPTTVDELVEVSFTADSEDDDVPANSLSYSLTGAPTGSSIDSNSGLFTWTPAEMQGPGTYDFQVVVTDNGFPAMSDSTWVSIAVAEVNSPPVLAPIGNQAADEGQQLTFTAVAADTDYPVDGLAYSLSGAPTGASIHPLTGLFEWTPGEDQGPGEYTFDVVVVDDGLPALADSESITVTVSEVDTPPTVTNPGDQTGQEGDAVDLQMTALDPDDPATSITWSAFGLPGGLVINPDTGRVEGVLDRPGHLTTAFTSTVIATDGTGLVGYVEVSWLVTPINLIPTANDDSFQVDELATLVIPAPGLLANDTDPEPGDLTVSLVAPPSRGDLNLFDDGSFVYSHTGGDDTDDSFVYRITDVGGQSAIATVSLEVLATNDAPVATEDTTMVAEDGVLLFDPLANDSDPEGDALSLVSIWTPTVGSASMTADGQLRFVPPPDFHGSATMAYVVSDVHGANDTGTITIVVTPINDAPVGAEDSFTFSNYLPALIPVLANDHDPDGDSLAIIWVDGVEVGQIDVEDDQLLYTPQSGWFGTTSFSYVVGDPAGLSDVVEVEVTVHEETQNRAVELLDDLEFGSEALAGLTPSNDPTELSTFSPIKSVNLAVNAFYQTLGAFRVPLMFLGMSLVVLVGLGGATKVPLLLMGGNRTHWSVVLLDREKALLVFDDPQDQDEPLYNFNPMTESILSTGETLELDGKTWTKVHTPRGEGWVDSFHLTEQVDLTEFMDDKRPPRLVGEFAKRLRAGEDVSHLLSKRGILLALTGHPTRLAPEQFADLLGGSRMRRLASVGGVLEGFEAFRIAVAEPFLAAFDATGEVTPDTAHSETALIPTEVWNFRYLSLGKDSPQPWLVFFEYEKGHPRIVGLGIDE